MKQSIKLNSITLMVLTIMLFCCKKPNVEPNSNQSISLSQQINNYDNQFSKQITKNSARTTTIDMSRAETLAWADAGAGSLFASAVTIVPILGPYIVLWAGFEGSRSACTWCDIDVANHVGGISYLNSDVASINASITSYSNNNPFNNIGNQHNFLLANLGTIDPIINYSKSTLTDTAIDYIKADTFLGLTTIEKDSVISMLNNGVPTIIKDTAVNVDTILLSSGMPDSVTYSLININAYIESNSMTSTQFIEYISGLENIVMNDRNLTQTEINDFLYYFAIIKYSYCYWSLDL
jgi:hypothetical protein